MMSPRMANDIAVAMRAMQLARKRRCLFTGDDNIRAVPGPAPAPPYRDVTVGALLTRLAEAVPDNDALVYGDRDLRWSFAALETEAREIAQGADGARRQPGRARRRLGDQRARMGRAAIRAGEDRRDPRHGQHGAARAGNRLPAAPERGGDAHHDSRLPRRRLPRRRCATSARSAAARLPALERVIFIGADLPAGIDRRTTRCARRRAEITDDRARPRASATLALDDVINMQYTSGTTGFPKGVMLSSRNIVNNGYWLGRGLGFTPRGSPVSVRPAVPLLRLRDRRARRLHARRLPVPGRVVRRRASVLETVERERCTALYGVPTMFLAELEDPEFARFDLASLRTGVMAGALCPGAADAARHRRRCTCPR